MSDYLSRFETGVAGLTTCGYAVLNGDGTTYAARATAGITELAGGVYTHTFARATYGGKDIDWDTGGASPQHAHDLVPDDLTYLDAAVSTRAAPGAAMTLTNGERSSLWALFDDHADDGLGALSAAVGLVDDHVSTAAQSAIDASIAANAAKTAAQAAGASADAKLDDVLAKTNTIGALAVTVTSPLAESGKLTLTRGDDYAAADGRAITFAVPDAGHVLALDHGLVQLKGWQFTWTPSSVAVTPLGYLVTFEPTAAQTQALTRNQQYWLQATLLSGRVVTRARGQLQVLGDIEATR